MYAISTKEISILEEKCSPTLASWLSPFLAA